MAVFHYALNPGGILFLSPSESIGHHADLFTPHHRKWKFYRASHATASTRAIMASDLSWVGTSANKMPIETIKKTKATNLAELTGRVLLQSYAPASVVTDLKGNILYVHGDTGPFLRPAPGQATLSVAEMAREGLQLELRSALLQIVNQANPTVSRKIEINREDGSHTVIFNLRPLPDLDTGETLLLMSFQEQPRTTPAKPTRKTKSSSVESERLELLEQELAYTKENLQATIEAQQATNEELHSSNEEMQSTNEELQSTNEELETSREELQSVNEELVTVNAELQAKVEQLASIQNDVKNLLDNLSVGTIFLDEQLVIRRFTQEAVRAYHLIASDVGRPLADIKSKVESNDLLVKAQTVLDSLIPYESELCTESGFWYLTRIQPYRTLDNMIQGVVLTFTDISNRVAAEAALQSARELADGVVNTVREPLLVLDGDLRVVTASRSFYRRFQVLPEDTLGRLIYELGNRQWDIPKLRELLETILPRDQNFDGYRVDHDFPSIGRRSMLLNARRILGKAGNTQLILLAMQDADKAS